MQHFKEVHISMVTFQDVTVMQQGSSSLFFKSKNFGIIWVKIRFLNFHAGSKTNMDISSKLSHDFI